MDIATESSYASASLLENEELYYGLKRTESTGQISVANCVKSALCKIERYEADIVKLESEHNRLINLSRKGGRGGKR